MRAFIVLSFALVCAPRLPAADAVPRWTVYEHELTSDRDYDHPLWDVTVPVQFTSPSNQIQAARAFWDGGRTWRFRFSPGETGRWTWSTSCSDGENSGLGSRNGEFDCTAYHGDNPLYQHGPIRLSQNRLFFEHEDAADYFFLSCTAWNGVLKSSESDWSTYLQTRQDQKFTAIQFVSTQWRGGRETLDEPVFIEQERLSVNPAMFQRMDQRVTAINAHAMVACPVVLWALNDDDPGNALSEEDALKLAQYILDRWGAHQVIWLLSGDCRFQKESLPRWKSLGEKLFADSGRLVTLHPSGQNWIGGEFQDQGWLDFLGYQSGHGDADGSLRWHVEGPVRGAWQQQPHRPIVNLEPNYEAHPAYQSKVQHSPQHVRRAAYWSLMIAPPAGVTYGHNAVWVWNQQTGPAEGHGNLKEVGPWTNGLHAPGAEDMTLLRQFFESGPRTQLRPASQLLVDQPGKSDPARFVSVASTADNRWTIAYVPAGDEIGLQFPEQREFSFRWFDPARGEWTPAKTVSGPHVRLKPPSEADWVADLRAQGTGQ